MGGTNGGGTVHSSEVTRRVPLVEEELFTLQVRRRVLLVEEKLPTLQK